MISEISRAASLTELTSNPRSFFNCPDLHGGLPGLPGGRFRSGEIRLLDAAGKHKALRRSKRPRRTKDAEQMPSHSGEFADISRSRTGRPYLKGITLNQGGIGEAGTRAVFGVRRYDTLGGRGLFMDRNASVGWTGTLREGTGTMTTESSVLSDTRYSFHTRFAQGLGTNPDELIAASLGGCFSMFLANELGLSGFHPQRIETTATATPSDAITFDHLDWGQVTVTFLEIL